MLHAFWLLVRVPLGLIALSVVLMILLRQRPCFIKLLGLAASLTVIGTACYPVVLVSVVVFQDYGSQLQDRSLMREDYPLRISQYRPWEGGINCDSDCSTMSSGDLVATWIGGRSGVHAAACATELGWNEGDQFVISDVTFECRDTGGWIRCYEPGDLDLAIQNAHAEGWMLDQPAIVDQPYCWVDLLGSWNFDHGQLIYNWSRVRMMATLGNDNPFLPYRGIQVQALNGMHGAGHWPGRDYLTPEGTPLYAPQVCPCRVIRSGFDGYVGQFGSNNSFIHLQTLDGVYDVVYLHGRYSSSGTVLPGQRIGSEASIGNSTDPHTHVSVRKNGILIDVEDY